MDPSPAPPAITLELALAATLLPALRRRLGTALRRARPITLTWYDRDAGHGGEQLVTRGIAVVAWREARAEGWCAESLKVAIGAPAEPLGEALFLAGLAELDLPDNIAPVQRFAGQLREGMADGVALRLVTGQFDAAPDQAIARLTLRGPAGTTAMLAHTLSTEFGLRMPTHSLAVEALMLAGMDVPTRPLGAPNLPAGLSPPDAFAYAASHLLGVLLLHAPRAAAGETGEPVHQMRVALRRLRSLSSLFRDAIACAEVAALRPALKALATALGPARDWDVFLAETGGAVATAFPDEPAVAALIAAVETRRAAAYADLATILAGPALTILALQTAILVQTRPWPASTQDTAAFGAALLSRRRHQVTKRSANPAHLPEAELHQLRLKAKRLRYAAEVFAPLSAGRPARKFLKRVAALQQALGLLNDGVVAASLMHALADDGGTGLAGGMVRGFVAARASDARAASARAWRRLRRAEVFWA